MGNICSCCMSSAQVLALELPTITPVQLKAYEGQCVRCVGRVAHNGRVFAAPFSGRVCVCFEAKVTERIEEVDVDYEGRRNVNWREELRAHEKRMVPFFVIDRDDATGETHAVYVPELVKEGVLETMVKTDVSQSSGFMSGANARMQRFLEAHGQSVQGGANIVNMAVYGYSAGRQLQYDEAVFEPGEIIAVIGTVVEMKTPDGPRLSIGPIDMHKGAKAAEGKEQDKAELLLRALKDKHNILIVTDHPDIIENAKVSPNIESQPKVNIPDTHNYQTPVDAPIPPYGFKPF